MPTKPIVPSRTLPSLLFTMRRKGKIPALSLFFGNTLWCSVAVIPLPQAAAVAAEGPCPAGGLLPPTRLPAAPWAAPQAG